MFHIYNLLHIEDIKTWLGMIIQKSIGEEEMEYEQVQRMTKHFIFFICLEHFNVSNTLANSGNYKT